MIFFSKRRAENDLKPFLTSRWSLSARILSKIFRSSDIAELGYTLVEPQILKAMYYQVPQKRERLFLVAIRNDLADQVKYQWPAQYHRVMTMRDAMFAGELFDGNVPLSQGQLYPERKKAVLDLVPQGGYWRDLPDDIQREYMKGSYFLGGGKTGMARRLSWTGRV